MNHPTWPDGTPILIGQAVEAHNGHGRHGGVVRRINHHDSAVVVYIRDLTCAVDRGPYVPGDLTRIADTTPGLRCPRCRSANVVCLGKQGHRCHNCGFDGTNRIDAATHQATEGADNP